MRQRVLDKLFSCVRIRIHKEKIMRDFDEINLILDQLHAEGMVEPVVEPIDDPSLQIDFYDWAEIVGIDVDEWAPEEYNA
jgi:hypothetical protein